MTGNYNEQSDVGAELMSLLDAFEAALDDMATEDTATERTDDAKFDDGDTVDDAVRPVEKDDPAMTRRAFDAIVAANWLAVLNEQHRALARNLGQALPTIDIQVPGLSDIGYEPEVEVEIDIDEGGSTATVTLLLNKNDRWHPDTRLRFCFADNSGDRTPLVRVSKQGVATFYEVSVALANAPGVSLRWTT